MGLMMKPVPLAVAQLSALLGRHQERHRVQSEDKPRIRNPFIVVLLSAQVLTAPAMDYSAVFTVPPQHVPTAGMPDGPLLGNGDVGVVLAGPPEAQAFYIGKNDFWTRHPGNAKVITVGRVELNLPGLEGATYRQEQDLARAEVRGAFIKGGLTVRTRSWVDANANLLITKVQAEGAPVTFSVHLSAGAAGVVPSRVADTGQLNVGREQHAGGRWYFAGDQRSPPRTTTCLSPGAAPSVTRSR